MALSRRSGARFQGSIWPGFVDAMTALLLVLMFVLTIFMIVQFILRETISGQETELDALTRQVASLADALGLERDRSEGLEADLGRVTASLSAAREEGEAQAALISRLTADLAAGEAARAGLETRIEDFETQVARLLAAQEAARGEVASLESELEAARGAALSLENALAAARSEIDETTEAARLAAARREALQALIADLRRREAASSAEALRQATEAERQAAEAERQAAAAARLATERDELAAELTDEEAARLAEAEAARLLRERLEGSETELTAMTLALEESRRRAEETLTLLAAAEAAKSDLEGRVEELSEAEKRAALLSVAEERLAEQLAETEAENAEAARRVALLNEQIAALRSQLGALQNVLDEASERDREAKVQIDALGTQLNTALAQVASEQRRRAELEEAERLRLEEEKARLEAEALDLEQYRSDFFGKLRQLLAGREGVRVVGDRFVFSSEVLFEPGSAALAPEGQSQIASVAGLLRDVAAAIPPGIDWVLRVDGHTDNLPLSGFGKYQDNWELSQGRALSVVRYMTDQLGFPPERLAATGFGEYRPVEEGDTPEARAQNRRIELKLTER